MLATRTSGTLSLIRSQVCERTMKCPFERATIGWPSGDKSARTRGVRRSVRMSPCSRSLPATTSYQTEGIPAASSLLIPRNRFQVVPIKEVHWRVLVNHDRSLDVGNSLREVLVSYELVVAVVGDCWDIKPEQDFRQKVKAFKRQSKTRKSSGRRMPNRVLVRGR